MSERLVTTKKVCQKWIVHLASGSSHRFMWRVNDCSSIEMRIYTRLTSFDTWKLHFHFHFQHFRFGLFSTVRLGWYNFELTEYPNRFIIRMFESRILGSINAIDRNMFVCQSSPWFHNHNFIDRCGNEEWLLDCFVAIFQHSTSTITSANISTKYALIVANNIETI